MKSLYPLLAILVVSVAVAAVENRAPDRPPGITAQHWLPINDSMGIVLVEPPATVTHPVDPRALLLEPPMQGYVMVKRGNNWRRLIWIEPVKGPNAAG